MNPSKLLAGSLLVTGLFAACNNETKPDTQAAAAPGSGLKEETITYQGDSATMNGYLVYEDSITKRQPVVLVVPEWWGLVDYPKERARQLAKLGYVALAIDMFGDGKTFDNPDSAKKYAMPFYYHPEKAKARIDAAIAKIKTYGMVDTTNIAAIGYCFGGGMVLNVARLGEDLKGVVSFHGTLLGTPARKDLLKASILVCHGNADKFVLPQEVAQFKKQMDSIGAMYSFVGYDSATHAFTNPNSTATGQKFNMPIAYNAKADTASWNEMKGFLASCFKDWVSKTRGDIK
ncbi:MAG TPA: dienelactone hydrolase family protein [Puia sp.]|nr:dienelactone hydrolase family protein [Puia sp.]